jgi:hypothetical protein
LEQAKNEPPSLEEMRFCRKVRPEKQISRKGRKGRKENRNKYCVSAVLSLQAERDTLPFMTRLAR